MRLCTLAWRVPSLVARALLLVFPNESVASVRDDVESVRCFPKSVVVVSGLLVFRPSTAASAPADVWSLRSNDVVQCLLLAALPNCYLSVILFVYLYGYSPLSSCVVHFLVVLQRARSDALPDGSPLRS